MGGETGKRLDDNYGTCGIIRDFVRVHQSNSACHVKWNLSVYKVRVSVVSVCCQPWKMAGSYWRSLRLALVTVLLLVAQSSGADSRRCTQSRLAECECATDENSEVTMVNCTNVGFNDSSVLTYMPQSVRKIIFVGNNIDQLDQNLMGNSSSKSKTKGCRPMPKLKFLDLSRNNVRFIDGKTFHCMGALESLILDDNDWFVDRFDHPRVFSGLHSLNKLSLRRALSPDYNETIEHITDLRNLFRSGNLTKLKDLDISNNRIWVFSPDAFDELPNLVRLQINNNAVATPRINHVMLAKLEELQLRNNSIAFLADSFMESLSSLKFLNHVNISDNPFQCDCNQIKTFEWLTGKNSSFIVDKNKLRCRTPQSMFNRTLLSLSKSDFICPNPKDNGSKLRTSYVIIGCIFGLLGIVFIAVMILNRYKIVNMCNNRIVEPIREALIGKEHHSYASVNV